MAEFSAINWTWGQLSAWIKWLDYPNWVWIMICVYLSLPVLVYQLIPLWLGNVSSKKRVVIVVLGDIGHSPRMCYHAESFANKGYDVDLCGYVEEKPSLELIENENIEIHEIGKMGNHYRLPFVIFGAIKVMYQVISLFSLLFRLRGMNYIMIQNPPSIPTMFVCVCFKIIMRTKLIIDWHNLGYTILSLKLGNSHPFVLVSKLYEHYLSWFSDINLVVTKKMGAFLQKEFGVRKNKITVLYDKPGKQFKPLSKDEKLQVIKNHPELFEGFDALKDKIIVSSTSFTPDEDFNVLIKSLKEYESQAQSNKKLPKIRCLITGKGPMKQQFLEQVESCDFKKITVKTCWLTAEEYPKIIGMGDLGVSLHTSSSGVDLPMKVLDMFGCGVPVVSMDFPAIDELVEYGVNGLTVTREVDMFEAFVNVFQDPKLFDKLHAGAMKKSEERWESNWKTFGDKV